MEEKKEIGTVTKNLVNYNMNSKHYNAVKGLIFYKDKFLILEKENTRFSF